MLPPSVMSPVTSKLPTMLVSILLFGETAERLMIWAGHHIIAPFTLFMCGVFRQVKGKEKLKGKGPFIIVSNHRSFLDILINAAAFPGIYKYLSKKEMIKVPIFGIIVKRLCILVDRKSQESRAESYQQMKKSLEKGYSILLYPEGTRNRTAEPLKDFYDGAFRLAAESGFPLAVLTLNDSGKLNDPVRELDLCPGLVKVNWDLIEDTGKQSVEELREKTKDLILGHLGARGGQSV